MNSLKSYLQRHNITIKALSERSGMSYNTVQKILHGDYSPTLEQAASICKAVGIRPAEMAIYLLDTTSNEWR